MIHPARSMVESLHAKGACPRIHVDLTCEGVVCPDFVLEKWKEELVIDLDPSYPLDLAFTDDAVEADLSFDGFVTRCVFPFRSIYVVADRESGQGVVLEENMPESVRRKRQSPGERAAALRASGKRDRASGESRRRRRPRPKPEAVPTLEAAPEPTAEPAADGSAEVEPVTSAETESAETESSETESSETQDTESQTGEAAEEEAQRRRSVFQVIDGGD